MAGELGDDLAAVVADLHANAVKAGARGGDHRPGVAAWLDLCLTGDRIVDVEPRKPAELCRDPQARGQLDGLTRRGHDVALHASDEAPKTRIAPPTHERSAERTGRSID